MQKFYRVFSLGLFAAVAGLGWSPAASASTDFIYCPYASTNQCASWLPIQWQQRNNLYWNFSGYVGNTPHTVRLKVLTTAPLVEVTADGVYYGMIATQPFFSQRWDTRIPFGTSVVSGDWGARMQFYVTIAGARYRINLSEEYIGLSNASTPRYYCVGITDSTETTGGSCTTTLN